MTFISYAQFFEDVFLWRCFKNQKNGFYIDVGAAWPDRDSVTKSFYDRGWSGINVEANPELYQKLCIARERDINLNIAVGEKIGELEISFFQNEGLSTADKTIAERHIARGERCVTKQIKATTLNKICSEHLDAHAIIDFLKVDVEGLEGSVLKSANFEQFRPKIVIVESTMPMTQEESWSSWEPLLLEANYLFCYFDGLNRFYVAHEYAHLQEHFLLPVNLWDDVVRCDFFDLQEKNKFLATEVESLRIAIKKLETENELLRQRLTRIYQSSSWRVTAPFRAFMSFLRTWRKN